uniref:Uncharacterized protein n=1 Tax=Oryza brachyantha TaxID=4533 RepID=J3NA97_ORYBR
MGLQLQVTCSYHLNLIRRARSRSARPKSKARPKAILPLRNNTNKRKQSPTKTSLLVASSTDLLYYFYVVYYCIIIFQWRMEYNTTAKKCILPFQI